MTRVYIICEGQTEETFVHEVLAKPLALRGVYLYPSLLGKPGHKGGNVRFARVHTDVRNRLLGGAAAYCTTLIDFYGLPEDFPGKKEAQCLLAPSAKLECVLLALKKALRADLGDEPMRRFIPYVQMFEFEGLLFSSCGPFAQGIGAPMLADAFQQIRKGFPSPEAINDSPLSAPSKRIRQHFPAYQKPLHGASAALSIGLDAIRSECLLFDDWLQQLESLGQSAAEADSGA